MSINISDDCISRWAAIEYIDNYAHLLTTGNHFEGMMNAVDLLKRLDLFPPVVPEPVCEDTISRQAAEEMIKAELPERGMWEIEGDKVKDTVCEVCFDLMQKLSELPPVEPKRSEIIRCKNCRHDNNCEIQYAAQAGSGFFCGLAESEVEK